jgi:fructokinase
VQEHETLPTGIVDVLLDEQKQATYTIVKPVAWDEISHSPDFVQLAEKAEVLVFGSLACRSETSYRTLLNLLETSKLAIFDMNLRPPHFEKSILQKLLSSCDILKINEHELDYLQETFHLQKADTETLLNELSEQSEIRTICVTLKGYSMNIPVSRLRLQTRLGPEMHF